MQGLLSLHCKFLYLRELEGGEAPKIIIPCNCLGSASPPGLVSFPSQFFRHLFQNKTFEDKWFVIYVVGCTQATPERHSNSYQSTDQQKMCWIGPQICFATAAKCLFHCNIAFLTVWSLTSCHLSLDNILKIFEIRKWFTPSFEDKFCKISQTE